MGCATLILLRGHGGGAAAEGLPNNFFELNTLQAAAQPFQAEK